MDLPAEKSAKTTREKLNELKSTNEDFSAATQLVSLGECESLHQDQTNGMLLQEKETRVQQESDKGNQGTEIIDAEEILQCDDSQFIGNKTGLVDKQAENHQENNTVDMASVVNENQGNHTPTQLSTYSQMPLYHQQQHPVEVNDTTESLRQNSEPTSGNHGQNNGLPVISTAQASPSHRQEEQTEYLPNDTSDVQRIHNDPPTSTNSKTPTTPISGSTTPVHQQSATGTPVQSPLDLNQHMKFIRQVVKSPGEGFMYQGRSMYNSHQVQAEDPEQSQRNEPEQRIEPEIIYEAPLNDQPPDISLNFFQPFTQQTENTNQNMFQTNTLPSPKRQGSMFLNSSPAKSGASGSPRAFSFGPCATSPSQNGSNFMSSSSPKGFFAATNQQPQSNNESFNSGFSLFGNSSGNNEDAASGGFSFSFGAKSPSKSNNDSGFSLF